MNGDDDEDEDSDGDHDDIDGCDFSTVRVATTFYGPASINQVMLTMMDLI